MIKFLTPHTFIFTYSYAVKFYYCIPYGNIVEPDQTFDLYQLSEKEKKTHFQLTVEVILFSYEPPHDKTNKMIRAPSEDSDQPCLWASNMLSNFQPGS